MRLGWLAFGLALAAHAGEPAVAPEKAKVELVEMEVRDVLAMDEGGHAVVLSPKGEEVILPIFIGEAEATAIRLRLDGRTPPRPLTHDLLETTIRHLGGKVAKIHIDDLKNDVFLGKVFLAQKDRTVEIDARPSDAIALALGAKAPIYCARKVIDAAGVKKRELERGRRRFGRPREEPPAQTEL